MVPSGTVPWYRYPPAVLWCASGLLRPAPALAASHSSMHERPTPSRLRRTHRSVGTPLTLTAIDSPVALLPTPPPPSSSRSSNSSSSSRSSKFFFKANASLFDGDRVAVLRPPLRLPALSDVNPLRSSLPFPPLLPPLDDDDEMSDMPLPELDADVLRLILQACPTNTLRDAKAVDKRTHRIAAELLRQRGSRFPRVLFGSGRCHDRRAAHRELPARWTHAAPAAGSSIEETGVRLSMDRTTITRPAGTSGWSTCLIDQWLSKDVCTIGLVFEELSGPACIGVVVRYMAIEPNPSRAASRVAHDTGAPR